MNWQATAFFLLALVLVGGFAWYERSRPPSRIVALVAAMAALAVAGRLILTPIPNVVATTDIVLFTGYAIGAGPGFAVGALAALVSNFWLGQGPWTPWEMAGWGLVGSGGAGLAAATRRRLGRIGLAAACGIAGFAYGALLDLSVMTTYGGEQSLDRYLAISARGIPFNVAHAAGNVVLALAAGPALVRMLLRFRARFEFHWSDEHRPVPSAGRAGLVALLLAIAVAPLAVPSAAHAAGPASGAAWLARAQNADGGFPASRGGASSASMTGWSMLGLEAGGRNPLDVRSGGHTPVGYLRSHAGRLRSVGDLERTILALRGAGVSSRRFGGEKLVGKLRSRAGSDGSFDGLVNHVAFGILALRASGGGASIGRSAAWLRRARNGDGGWGYAPSAASDPDSTGAALQALAAAGSDKGLRAGVGYLRRTQHRDGGWSLVPNAASNSQSTAWAVQGLIAARANPGALRKKGRTPFSFLGARQSSDGHYRYSASNDQTPVWVTSQAVLAVAREPFPLAPVPRDPAAVARAANRKAAEGNRAKGASDAQPSQGEGEQPRSAVRAKRAKSAPPSATGSLASSDDDGGGDTGRFLLGGLALLAAALIAGFVWYRRRLPY